MSGTVWSVVGLCCVRYGVVSGGTDTVSGTVWSVVGLCCVRYGVVSGGTVLCQVRCGQWWD